MNTLFALIFIVANAVLLCVAPDAFLSTLLDATSKSATLCISLIATYSVWLGLMRDWEDSGVSRLISKKMKPLAKRLFAIDDDNALDAVCMNLSVNFLGISGAGTPYGVKAVSLLDKGKNADYASCMFFVFNATSLQLIPTSMIGLRTALHSANASAIILPTILTTICSTVLGVLLVKLLIHKDDEKSRFAKPTCYKKHRAGA